MVNITIPDVEFKERVANAQNLMKKMDIDTLLAFSTECEPAYVRYFADYWTNFETAAVIIPQAGEPVLLIGPECRTYAGLNSSKIARIIQLEDFRESSQPEYPNFNLSSWQDVFGEYRTERLGMAGCHMFPHSIYMKVQKALGKGEMVEADSLVRQLMIKKSRAEIDCLRESARISETGLKGCPGKNQARYDGSPGYWNCHCCNDGKRG